MTPEQEVLKQIIDIISLLDDNERSLVGNCINEIKRLIDQYGEFGILAVSFIGAEMAATDEGVLG